MAIDRSQTSLITLRPNGQNPEESATRLKKQTNKQNQLKMSHCPNLISRCEAKLAR